MATLARILLAALLAAAPPSVTYRTLNQEITDGPAKTEIVQHVLVTGAADEAELRAELDYRLEQALARDDFAYHNPATDIFIYIYATEAEARQASKTPGSIEVGWLAMTSRTKAGGETPVVQIDPERLRGLQARSPALPGVGSPPTP